MTSFRSMSGRVRPLLHVLDRALERVDHLQRAGPELAEDRDVHLALAVDPDDVGLDEGGVLGGRHVAQVGRVAVLGVGSGMSPMCSTYVEHRVGVEGVVGVAELGVAGRQEDVVVVDRLHHVERREAARLQLARGRGRASRRGPCRRRPPARRAGLRHDHVADLVAADVVEDRLVVAGRRCPGRGGRPASCSSGRTAGRPAAACPAAGWGSTARASELTCVSAPLGSTLLRK